MSSSCQSQSPEALSDPMPRIYACFCQKLFTTYPGIYLHLKSKHGNLFQKYKRLKITKLFKKTRDQKGSEIYKLERLSEKEGTQNFIYQKKIKQITKKNDSEDQQDNNNALPDIRTYQLRKKSNIVIHQNISKKEPTQNELKIQPNHQRLYHEQFENPMPYPNPFMNFPFGMPPPFPPMFHQFPPMFPHMKLPLKKVMERFLVESDISEKEILKNILYDLVIFIDKNCDTMNDPRANGRLFLSYCDDFDPKHVGTILNDYILNKKQQLSTSEMQEPFVSQKSKEIETLLIFNDWMINMGYLQLPMREQMVFKQQSQNQKYQQQMNFSTTKTEKNNNKNAEISEVIQVNSNE